MLKRRDEEIHRLSNLSLEDFTKEKLEVMTKIYSNHPYAGLFKSVLDERTHINIRTLELNREKRKLKIIQQQRKAKKKEAKRNGAVSIIRPLDEAAAHQASSHQISELQLLVMPLRQQLE